LVKHRLELILTQPSELAEHNLRRDPALVYGPADIPVHVVWTAWQAYDLDWPTFCPHVPSHPAWQAVLGVQIADGAAQDSPLTQPLLEQAVQDQPDLAHRCCVTLGDASYDAIPIFEFIVERLRALPVITKNPRNAADPQADLATDELGVLRRPSVCHRALFRSRTAVERTNSRIKLTFNLKYHKQRGRNAVEHCALFAAIAMLGVARVALDTGQPDKLRSAWTWLSLKRRGAAPCPCSHSSGWGARRQEPCRTLHHGPPNPVWTMDRNKECCASYETSCSLLTSANVSPQLLFSSPPETF
jgi:hypothetical protein